MIYGVVNTFLHVRKSKRRTEPNRQSHVLGQKLDGQVRPVGSLASSRRSPREVREFAYLFTLGACHDTWCSPALRQASWGAREARARLGRGAHGGVHHRVSEFWLPGFAERRKYLPEGPLGAPIETISYRRGEGSGIRKRTRWIGAPPRGTCKSAEPPAKILHHSQRIS